MKPVSPKGSWSNLAVIVWLNVHICASKLSDGPNAFLFRNYSVISKLSWSPMTRKSLKRLVTPTGFEPVTVGLEIWWWGFSRQSLSLWYTTINWRNTGTYRLVGRHVNTQKTSAKHSRIVLFRIYSALQSDGLPIILGKKNLADQRVAWTEGLGFSVSVLWNHQRVTISSLS